ncbi:hypothetical protein [Sciscionella marina]|uniref:hypothetical protein n=1 Tax=Sciscionella marina TaxID=508770 RepID=UPI0003A1D449|nr:hypothetical protein [Sciscionella marina]
MSDAVSTVPDEVLPALREVIEGPRHEIAARLSRLLANRWPHTALVIFTRECTGRPRKLAGDTTTINKVTLAELEELKAMVEPGVPRTATATIAGAQRTAWVVLDPVGTLLVLIPCSRRRHFPDSATLAKIFGIVATSIRQQVSQVSPDYLAESRAASSERARTIAELSAPHETTLVTILTSLRSAALDDHQARHAATDSAALVALRSAQTSDLASSDDSRSTAFTKLRKEIRQMLQHHDAHIEFTAPSKDAPALPGEVAKAAHAMTRTAVLAFTAQPGARQNAHRLALQRENAARRCARPGHRKRGRPGTTPRAGRTRI